MRESECTYKSEKYTAREDGMVLRHSPIDKKKRAIDNKWTFGAINKKSGYLVIASERVHRIVATAFHGEAPTKEHVVDHIDTNKQNNRPENLRWVTKLENILLNPITVRKIELVCGSVEAFLENPSAFRDLFPEPNYNWMCNVSIEEAKISLERLTAWSNSGKTPDGGSIDFWIFNRGKIAVNVESDIEQEFTISKTSNAVQLNWSTSCEFPLCPNNETKNPIADYKERLKIGSVFCRNEYNSNLVEKAAISDDGLSIYVVSKSEGIKPWALAKISFENDLFVHEAFGTYFQEIGVEKQYSIKLGLGWDGGETFDELC